MKITLNAWAARAVATLLAGACAFAGALLSTDQRVTGAIWSASAFVVLSYAAIVAAHVRTLRKDMRKMLDESAHALTIGARARWVYFSAIQRDGTLYADTLEDLIKKAPAEGGTVKYDQPWHVSLTYADTTKVGARDGRPI